MPRPKGIIRKIADETGLDHATVRRALAAAELTEAQAGADFDGTVETVIALADTDRVIGHAANGRGEGGSNGNAYADARAQSELHRAEKLRLQNAQLSKQLIDRDSATATVVRVLADLRAALMATGVRLAPSIMGAADTKTIARLIEDELRNTLATFADADKLLSTIEDEALT